MLRLSELIAEFIAKKPGIRLERNYFNFAW